MTAVTALGQDRLHLTLKIRQRFRLAKHWEGPRNTQNTRKKNPPGNRCVKFKLHFRAFRVFRGQPSSFLIFSNTVSSISIKLPLAGNSPDFTSAMYSRKALIRSTCSRFFSA